MIIKLVELKNGSLQSKTSVIIESAFDQQILVSLVVRATPRQHFPQNSPTHCFSVEWQWCYTAGESMVQLLGAKYVAPIELK